MGQRIGRGGAVEDVAIPGTGLRLTGAEPGAIVLRVAQGAVMNVADAHRGECLGQLRLRQARFAAQRGQAHIHQDSHILFEQLRNEITDGLPFVADAHHGSFACGAILVCGVTGPHGFLSCAPPLGTGR